MNAYREASLEARGGSIPSARLIPLIERFEQRDEMLGREHDGLRRRIHKVRHEQERVSFDLADRLLIDMGMSNEWHNELADLYEIDVATPASLRSGPPRYLTHDQIAAAYRLYESGMSAQEIGRLIWRRFGYLNAWTCSHRLMDFFRQQGRRTRSASETNLAYSRRYRRCVACGCAPDERTRGCLRCSQRHWMRAQRGSAAAAPSLRAVCSGCEVEYDDKTPGCSTCDARYWSRSWRSRNRGPAVHGDVETVPAVSVARTGGNQGRGHTPSSTEREAA